MSDHLYNKKWKYKNTALLILTLVFFLSVMETKFLQDLIESVASLGYWGAFLAGIFFISIFTVAPATVILFVIATSHNVFLTGLFAGLGGVIGDYILFKTFRSAIFKEWAPIFADIRKSHLGRLFHTPFFAWTLPVLGAVLIASPFPDELGVGILGLSRLKTWQFLLLALILDVLGVTALLLLARL